MEITGNAYNVARDHVCAANHRAKDDVLKVLLPMLETNETLRKHQEQHKARFKHYREAYAEYMIDIYFKSLPPEEEQ